MKFYITVQKILTGKIYFHNKIMKMDSLGSILLFLPPLDFSGNS